MCSGYHENMRVNEKIGVLLMVFGAIGIGDLPAYIARLNNYSDPLVDALYGAALIVGIIALFVGEDD